MFEDTETLTVEYLRDALADLTDPEVAVSTHVLSPLPASLVRVMQTANRRTDVAHRLVQMTVECWNADEAAASGLSSRVEAELDAWWRVPDGAAGWLSGPYSSPDPTTGTPRYVMTCFISQKVS